MKHAMPDPESQPEYRPSERKKAYRNDDYNTALWIGGILSENRYHDKSYPALLGRLPDREVLSKYDVETWKTRHQIRVISVALVWAGSRQKSASKRKGASKTNY
jgi:hypothetical protein